MEPGGWIIMLLSVGFVTSLFVSCVYKVLTHKKSTEHMQGMEIDTGDVDKD
jgi:hypothetical protein